MPNSHASPKFYDRYGGAYSAFTAFTGHRKGIQRAIARLEIELPKNPEILDLGCGTGLATEVLLEKFPDSRITGFDFSEGMLKLYLEKFPNVGAIIGDFNTHESFNYHTKKPLSLENSFDLVISTGSISEYGDLEKAVPFVYSMLKANSLFINLGNDKKTLAGKIINTFSEFFWNFKCTDREEFASVCRKAGFNAEFARIPVSAFPANLTKYAVLAGK